MGRRKPKHLDDDFDSSDSGGYGSDDSLEGLVGDERAEALLFKNPSGRNRNRKRNGKEEALLGVWADDDEAKGAFGAARRSVAFVAKTADEDEILRDEALGEDDEDDDEESDDDDDDDDDEEAEKVPRDKREDEDEDDKDEMPVHRGLGLGFAPQPQQQKPSAQPKPAASSSSSSYNNQQQQQQKPAAKKQQPIILDARQQQQQNARLNPVPDKDFMKFDKEGKGLMFLKMMGYKPGQGLGKEGVGIVNPIDVKLRPQKMGLGHRGFDERTETVKMEQRMKRGDKSDSDDSDTTKPASKKDKKGAKVPAVVDQWKRGAASKNKGKVAYKTADELIQEAAAAGGGGHGFETGATKQGKIIDMTGAQARELSNMSELATGAQIAALREAASNLVELRYNVRTMASEAEMDLLRLSKAWSLETKTVERTRLEMDGMQKHVQVLEGKKVRLEQVIQLAQQVVEEGKRLEKNMMVNGTVVTSEEIDASFSSLFQRIQTEYFDEYVEHRLDSLVVGAMAPLIKRMLVDWSPLEDPTFGVESFRKWRTLFRFSVQETPTPSTHRSSQPAPMRAMTPFESMMYNIWLPKVRQDINNNWSPLNPDPCTTLLETWYPSTPSPQLIITNGLPSLADPTAPHLLPPWIHTNNINQLILPKLLSALSAWDPRSPTSAPPHQWLFPWLPILRHHRFLRTLTDPIQQKLAMYLTDWHPSNATGMRIVSPWKEVLPRKVYDAILVKNVLPKLVAVLRHEFHVNPAAQDLVPLVDWVLPWRHEFSQPLFSHLIETEVFPKWIQVLWLWLGSGDGVNFDEVSRWYLAWRSVFPEDVGEWKGVVEGFRVGLEMMNRAVSGEGVGGAVPRLVPVAERGEVVEVRAGGGGGGGKKEVTGKPELMRRKEVDVGFLELLERMAGAVGLVLLPTARVKGGKAVWGLERDGEGKRKGKKGVLLYVDEGVVFVYLGGAVGDEEGQWEAMGVDEVVALALKS
ncbi:hypothetical protein HDU98_006950 [Podochytrium sp. JEL0797]|nr:hypothetical protein HDU98_006950 [Podochytrium sp. JEL0797]